MNQLLADSAPIWQHYTVIILLCAIALLLLLAINRQRLQHLWQTFASRRCLNRLGQAQLDRISCIDELGDEFTIDRLLLRTDGITVLICKKYPGRIYCADQIDQWTQVIGRQSYKFANPLFELNYQVKALRSCAPGIDIDGYLFFDHQAEFPKGHPDQVIHPQRIPQSLKPDHSGEVKSQVLSAWHRLKQQANRT